MVSIKKVKAKYQIKDTFIVTGRGLVLVGTILEGTINVGDFIVLNYNEKNLERKIRGIEGVRNPGSRSNTGIIVECKDEKEITTLRAWKPYNEIADIL